jgi:hypothetical protein
MIELTPEILDRVAQVGDSYVNYLILKTVLENAGIYVLLGLFGYAIYRVIKHENKKDTNRETVE